jgi:hypothetical protein
VVRSVKKRAKVEVTMEEDDDEVATASSELIAAEEN